MTAIRLPAVSTWSVGQCEVCTQRPRKSSRPGNDGRACLRELAGGHDQVASGDRLAVTRGDAVSVRCRAPTVHR